MGQGEVKPYLKSKEDKTKEATQKKNSGHFSRSILIRIWLISWLIRLHIRHDCHGRVIRPRLYFSLLRLLILHGEARRF